MRQLDFFIEQALIKWRLAEQNPTDDFRGLYISDDEADQWLHRPFSANWGTNIKIPPDIEARFTLQKKELQEKVKLFNLAVNQQNHSLRLDQIVRIFGLTQTDKTLFLLVSAPALDLKYEKIFAYLQNDVSFKKCSVNLALDILSEAGVDRTLTLDRLTPDSPLIKHNLISFAELKEESPPNMLSRILVPDSSIVKWLVGRYIPASSSTILLHTMPHHPEDEINLLTKNLLLADENLQNRVDLILLHGPDAYLRKTAAKKLAILKQTPLFEVHPDLKMLTSSDSFNALQRSLRDASLFQALLLIELVDTEEPKIFEKIWGILRQKHPDQQVLLSLAAERPIRNISEFGTTAWIHCKAPDYQHRREIWHYYLTQQEPESPVSIDALASQFLLKTDQIRDVCASAVSAAQQENQSISQAHLFHAARLYSSSQLEKLARKVKIHYQWEDLILPPDQLRQLHEIVGTVRQRPKVLETWQLGQKLVSSTGITTLFCGPSGTGKTMAAEVIAQELNLDLYKIDLSTVVSKYIGETEKNLETIFQAAETSNAILFFDEADSLFGKRSEVKDAHDRYANIEISYLLQRMEAYTGLAILATNLRANLDEAFTRRLQFVVNFPFPDQPHRKRIWEVLFPDTLPKIDNIDFDWLSHRHKFTGGNIRNIIVAAAYLAAEDGGVVTIQHIQHGTRRELQKIGRLIDEELTE
ncbi:MAG: AAA family ATPase [Anaerolineaceae bacterium]|nr:AAA family ATPase [Anaerolineaceae bacterium]